MVSRRASPAGMAFMACERADFPALAEGLALFDRNVRWTFVSPYPAPGIPSDRSIQSRPSLFFAIRIWSRCLTGGIDRVAVCLPHGEDRAAIGRLITFVAWLPVRARFIFDLRGHRGHTPNPWAAIAERLLARQLQW